MRPYVYKFDHTAPVRLVLPDLHEVGIRFAEERFARKGQAPFMWILAAGTHLAWVETPWEDDREKMASVELIKSMMRELGVHAYVFMSEVWIARYAKEPDDDTPSPRERPESERDDALMITSFDRDGAWLITKYKVTDRKGRGLNFLGPRVDIDPTDGKYKGRLFNLLSKL